MYVHVRICVASYVVGDGVVEKRSQAMQICFDIGVSHDLIYISDTSLSSDDITCSYKSHWTSSMNKFCILQFVSMKC